jgi:ribosome-binding protein aMBF1 (putative translation factor)
MGHDKSSPPPTPSNCEFCGHRHKKIIRGKIGGMKPRICEDCVIRYAIEIVRRTEALAVGGGE